MKVVLKSDKLEPIESNVTPAFMHCNALSLPQHVYFIEGIENQISYKEAEDSASTSSSHHMLSSNM